jgi:hypothetical protein
MHALERMGAFLRAQEAMVVKMDTTTDEILDSGQKIQLQSAAELKMKRPNRLVAEMASDRKTRRYFYDGQTFTIYAPRDHFFAKVAAPPTLRELAEMLAGRYDIELPLADLFYWGTEKSGAADIVSAINVGPATVQGVPTDHYAFRQRDVDWQIWIQRGAEPLPRKLVITTTQEPGQPQYAVVTTWQLKPRLDDRDFAFRPPRDAHEIPLRELGVPPSRRQGRAARPR